MPSTFSRKPWTKCCRDCSPSVTMSTPASSCSFSASMVASRFAFASSVPVDFQGAHNLLGSASHSGFGKEPAIVVGNSMDVSPDFDLDVYLPCLSGHVHISSSCPGLSRASTSFLLLQSQGVDGRDIGERKLRRPSDGYARA